MTEGALEIPASSAVAVMERSRLLSVVVGAVVLLVAVLAIMPWPVGVFQDDGVYAILAKSIAEGRGYRYLNIPGEPAAVHYPPGYPLFLAALWKLSPQFPQNVALFKFANAALLALSAVGAYRFGVERVGLSHRASALASIATSACIPALLLAGILLSEPLFLALLFPTLARCERATDADESSLRDAAVAGLLVAALALVRTLGLALLPAAVLVMLSRRRYRQAAVFAACAVIPLVPWQLWLAAHEAGIPSVLAGKYGSYLGWAIDGYREGGADFARQVLRKNLLGSLGFVWVILSAAATVGGRVAATVFVAVLVVLGTRHLLARTPTTALFFGAYVAVVIVWPFAPDRFYWGAWPLFGLLVAAAPAAAARWKSSGGRGRVAHALVLASTALVSLGYAAYNVNGARKHWWDSPQRQSAERARPTVEWIAANTAPDDVLVTDDDVMVYLYTGRRAVANSTFTASEYVVANSDSTAVAAMRDIVGRYRPRFVVVSTLGPGRAAQRLTEANPPELRFLGMLRTGAVFEPVRAP